MLEVTQSNSEIVKDASGVRDEHRSILAKATLALLDPASDDGVHNCAVADLYTLFSKIAGIDGLTEVPEDSTDTLLNHGLALSPRNAARCIFHHKRTARFLEGLKAAVIEAQRRFPGQTIHVLYAGCGPYATLATPLTTQFRSDEVQFTLLDIHQRSLNAVQRITDALEITDYFRDFIKCDAAEYRHSGGPIHVVVTETMQKALDKEPQVAITLNLVPQLCEGGLLVPESISLNICIAEVEDGIMKTPEAETDQPVIDLGKVFEIAAETRLPSADSEGKLQFQSVHLRIPISVTGNRKLVVLTRIGVFQSIAMVAGDGWLSLPTPILELGDIGEGTEIEFFYTLGKHPGLKYRII